MLEAPKVLVVDDKLYIRQLLATALALRGYEVLTACDGREGLEMVRRHRPRLVLLDLLMPGCNGYETLRRLRGDPETVGLPVVVMSARGEIDGPMPPPGAQGCLLKPFDLERMEALVARHAGPARPRRAAVAGISRGEVAAAAPPPPKVD